MMLLTIDIGNTLIKGGIFIEHQLTKHFIVSEKEEINSVLTNNDVTDIIISSVVPSKTRKLIQELGKTFPGKPVIVNKDTRFNLQIKYNSPDTLGMDRICSAEGAFALSNKNLNDGTFLVTIDFGTATTINIVQSPNIFVGGLIAPGINTMFKSLNSHTSQLPEITIENYLTLIGQNTKSSIASGVIHSTCGLVERTLNYISELDECGETIVYATGGLARKVLKYLPDNIIYDEYLVLKGMDSIYKLNKD